MRPDKIFGKAHLFARAGPLDRPEVAKVLSPPSFHRDAGIGKRAESYGRLNVANHLPAGRSRLARQFSRSLPSPCAIAEYDRHQNTCRYRPKTWWEPEGSRAMASSTFIRSASFTLCSAIAEKSHFGSRSGVPTNISDDSVIGEWTILTKVGLKAASGERNELALEVQAIDTPASP